MKIKTADLIGPPLDWAVAWALGWVPYPLHTSDDWLRPEAINRFEKGGYFAYLVKNDEIKQGVAPYSTSGSEVIDIMEREGIAAWLDFDGKTWRAADKRWTLADPDSEELARMSEPCSGPTLRIAVCRCLCASKLGDEVEVPDELLEK